MASGSFTDVDKKEMKEIRRKLIEDILNGKDEDLLSVKGADIPAPEKARVYPSRVCQECKERFMEIMGRTANGKVLCKDCFEKMVC